MVRFVFQYIGVVTRLGASSSNSVLDHTKPNHDTLACAQF